MRYDTPTRSGLTDAQGTFKYLAGESVAFSVGGIALGHAPGASQITPFTLAGLTPPTTEPALRRELDRATRTTSHFVRATNIARLLLALDADNNPANGIDLRGRDAALANAAVNFDQTIIGFATALEKLAPDLTHNMPRWLPIVHLYRALDIAVPAHARETESFDLGGSYTQTTNYSYNPDGSVESRSSSDGPGGSSSSVVYGYDAMGRTTFMRQDQDFIFWGVSSVDVITRYDARGNLLSRTYDSDQGADGLIDVRQFSIYETDAYANILSEVSQVDYGIDGTIERGSRFSAQFDSRLNPYSSTWSTDSNMDGVTDQLTTWNVEYDTNYRPVTEQYETDDGADGIIDSRETTAFIPALNRRDVSEVRVSDLNADGVAEIRTQTDWVHNADGSLRTVTTEVDYDSNNDEVADGGYHEVATFDRERRAITNLVSQDWEGDGVVDVVSHRTSSYDNYGNILAEVSESDTDGDGQWDTRTVTDYEYGAGAELLGSSNSTQYTNDGPRFPNGSTRVTNIPLANGVLMLAQRYMEYRFGEGFVAVGAF